VSEIVTPATVPEALRALAEGSHPRPPGGAYLGVFDRRGQNEERLSYPDLVRAARAWGAWFEDQGVKPGEVVLLCLPTSQDLVAAFLGASLIRALPCNLALPRAVGGMGVFKRRVEALIEHFPGGQVLTTPDVAAELPSVSWTPPKLDLSRQVTLEPVDPKELAYVQLTSGSTSLPKAVSITHENLSRNVGGIFKAGVGDARRDQFVSWLPLYHDMGLVGMTFTALFHGAPLSLMRPETFVGRPVRWLEALGRCTSAITAAPNFGYQWCVDRISHKKLVGLDLSGWHLGCCGAEPIRVKTLQRFRERFGPYGLRDTVLTPCYGMAEATLAVTFGPVDELPRLDGERVSCGRPLEGLEVAIKGPAGAVLSEGEVGEIVVRGNSVFPGYFQDPVATRAALREGWLHTGDQGYLEGGELYVTGRIKDLIVLDGANFTPLEFEVIAEEHSCVGGGRAVAFSVEIEQREAVVVVVEARQAPAAEVREAIKGQAANEVAALHDLVFVRRGSLPKTSSGKTIRGQVRELYLKGELQVLVPKAGVAAPRAEA
jgi:fatty-acyl-CoA synthase